MDDERCARIVAAAVAQGIADAGLAKKEDVQNLSGKLDATSEKMGKMEERILNLEKFAAETTSIGSAGSRASSTGPPGRRSTGIRSTTTAASQDDESRPRLIKLAGWAPFGCGAEKKLQKSEALEAYKRIAELMDEPLRGVVSATPPYLLKHCLAYRVDAGDNIYSIAGKTETLLATHNFTIRGAALRSMDDKGMLQEERGATRHDGGVAAIVAAAPSGDTATHGN